MQGNLGKGTDPQQIWFFSRHRKSFILL